MANLVKVKEIFENYTNSNIQLNNASLYRIARDIKPYISREEYLAVDEMLTKYNSENSIQINNRSLDLIYNNLESKILLLDECICLENCRSRN
ncbi:hypothetical protein HOD61_01190 [archaeon]|jgi:hypothetical protein|nr:hypothetical protein [archaeon]